MGILAGTIAFGMQLYAIQFVHVSIFEATKRAIGLILAMVSGRLLFKEELTRGKVLGRSDYGDWSHSGSGSL